MPTLVFRLRLMAEVSTITDAEAVIEEIVPQLEPLASIRHRTIERYWKTPSYQEITLDLLAHGDAHRAYDQLLTLVGTGWTTSPLEQERWAVWNPTPDAMFLSPTVRWAEVQLSSGASGEDLTQQP